MNPNVQEQIDEQEVKIDQILQSVQKTEKYMRVTLWITIIVVVLPILLLVVALPIMINSYTSAIGGLL